MDKRHGKSGKTILALETAIDGGSVAILEKGRQIGQAEGAGGLSKSEDILLLIEDLLIKNGIEKKEIGRIAVSDGPGSLTGLRIGLAIAKGLGDAFAAEVWKISVLEALTYRASFEGRVISGLYSKKSGIFFREFMFKGGKPDLSGEILQTFDITDFINKLDLWREENISFIFTRNLLSLLGESFEKDKILNSTKIFSVEGNLASVIGLAAAANASDNDKNELDEQYY